MILTKLYYELSDQIQFYYMKQFTEEQIDDLLKLKFGKVVEESGHTAFVSNKTLGKIYKISEHKIAGMLWVRFAK